MDEQQKSSQKSNFDLVFSLQPVLLYQEARHIGLNVERIIPSKKNPTPLNLSDTVLLTIVIQ